jgi:hypothetical protein
MKATTTIGTPPEKVDKPLYCVGCGRQLVLSRKPVATYNEDTGAVAYVIYNFRCPIPGAVFTYDHTGDKEVSAADGSFVAAVNEFSRRKTRSSSSNRGANRGPAIKVGWIILGMAIGIAAALVVRSL